MSRDYKIYLNDILKAIERIERYAGKLTKENFVEDELVVDGVVRNLEIIGEATRQLPENFKDKHINMPWGRIISMRNKVIHEYSGVDVEILWQTIHEDLPALNGLIKKLV